MPVVIIHSTALLSLSFNSLTGTVPNQIAMLTSLSKLSIVWLLVMIIVLSNVSLHLLRVIIFNSTAELYLWLNSLTGTIPSQIALLTNLSELNMVWLFFVTIVFVVCFIVLTVSSFFILNRCLVAL
jgi:hypothetical protein